MFLFIVYVLYTDWEPYARTYANTFPQDKCLRGRTLLEGAKAKCLREIPRSRFLTLIVLEDVEAQGFEEDEEEEEPYQLFTFGVSKPSFLRFWSFQVVGLPESSEPKPRALLTRVSTRSLRRPYPKLWDTLSFWLASLTDRAPRTYIQCFFHSQN